MRLEATEEAKDVLVGATSRVGARAVIAGALCALACQALLMALGAAIGLSAMKPTSGQERGVAIYYYVWLICTLSLSAFIGGWVSALTAHSPVRRDGVLNGFVTWALLSLVGTMFVGGAALRAIAAAFGFVQQRDVSVDAERARDVAGLGMWAYFLALAIPLVFALIGGALASRGEQKRLGLIRERKIVEERITPATPPTTPPVPA